SDSSDTGLIAKHRRRASDNATIKQRLREVDDELELVIVKDMMLTGYDSPPLHTLYLDRPLKGALLMQTLARVNRTFKEKDAGLLVGYAPLADNLRRNITGDTLQRWQAQRRALYLISTGDRRALAAWGPLSIEGAWVWRWKDHIDRAFMARFSQRDM
ncbi:MAG TPA: hypothetical protein PK620_10590, partial [Denitromonas sp.]|nr:hypothetical protein [Denitromonas sp.]